MCSKLSLLCLDFDQGSLSFIAHSPDNRHGNALNNTMFQVGITYKVKNMIILCFENDFRGRHAGAWLACGYSSLGFIEVLS